MTQLTTILKHQPLVYREFSMKGNTPKHSNLLKAFIPVFCLLAALAASANTQQAYSLKKTDEIIAGVLKNWPPQYSTDTETGEPAGFAIDIFDEVTRRAGIKVRYRAYDSWPELNDALIKREIHAVPNMGIIPERLDLADYTVPVEAFQIHTFVRETNTDIKHLNDLKGLKVGVVEHNKGLFIMKQRGDSRLEIYEHFKDAFLGLLSGEVDALVYPQPPVMRLAYQAGLADRIKTVGEPLLEVKRAIGILKDEPELLGKLNQAVTGFVKSDEYRRIYRKWYGAPQPFWTLHRIIWLVLALVLAPVLVMSLWHYRVQFRLNRELQDQIKVRKSAEAALRKAHEELERKVDERTSQLRQANEKLTDEITARIQAEEAIKTSLGEKEILLQEIHHRVKNNLAVVSSLLNLQSMRVEDENTRQILQDSQNRLQTMSMIHETLYRSDNLSSINMQEYLTELAASVFKSFSISNRVTLKVNAEGIVATAKQSSPIGLIVNELITNSLKYAFPDNRRGEIDVVAVKDEENTVELTLSDNGVGFPQDFDWRNTDSLGLILVRSIAENQLKGSIELDTQAGTRFIIRFQIEDV